MALQNTAGVATFGFNALAKYTFMAGPNTPTSWFYGGVQFPLAATSANSLLQDADPALYYALDYFEWALQQYLGARWASAAAAANYRGSDQNVLTRIVNCSVAYNPLPELTSGQFALPLMCIYRVSSTGRYKTVMKSEETNVWQFVHIMPPMDASTMEFMLPMQHAMQECIDNRTEQGRDPNYTPPGGALGQSVWKLAGIEEIQCVGFQYELYPDSGNLPLPVLMATFQVKEEQGKYIGFQPFQGAAASINVFDPTTDTTLDDVVQVDTWVPIVPAG